MTGWAVKMPATHTNVTDDFQFDLDGGLTCLDFANTHDSAGEHLTAYPDLLAFATRSKLITPQDAAGLRAEALREPARAEGVIARAHRLRDSIYGIFSAVAAGEAPREQHVDRLNFELAATLQHARVLPAWTAESDDEPTYRWGWVGASLDTPLWPITRSAADLLTDDQQRRRVRECGGADCHWLFLDSSKNQTRQWCSMRSCGNREKARRHYQKSRRLSASSPDGGGR
jgi:predicted RNA-binding Zn ribbon-like protein